MSENILEKPTVKEDQKLSRKKLIIIFIALLIFLALGVAAILLLSRRLEPANEGRNSGTTATTVSVSPLPTIDPMTMYLADYDLVTLEGGDINLTNVTRTKTLNLTQTGGKVVSFVISKDLTKLAYTISDPEFVEPLAASMERAYEEFRKANFPYVSPSGTPLSRNRGAKLFVLDLSTNLTKEVARLTDIPVPTDKADFQELMVNWEGVWQKNFVTPLAFNEEGTYLVYSMSGLNAINLDFQVSQKLAFEGAPMCYGFYNAIWEDNTFSISQGCYEWSEDHIFRFTDGAFTEIDLKDLELGSYIGKRNSIIGLSTGGIPTVINESFEVSGRSTTLKTIDLVSKQVASSQVVDNQSLSLSTFKVIEDQIFVSGGRESSYTGVKLIAQLGKIFTMEQGKPSLFLDIPDMLTLDLNIINFDKKSDKFLVIGYKNFYKERDGKDSNFFKYYYVDVVTKEVKEYMIMEVPENTSGIGIALFER